MIAAYTAGPDVSYLCPPLCLRKDSETTITWAAYRERGDAKILSWRQAGINATCHSIPLLIDDSPTLRIFALDATGEIVLFCHGNSRFICFAEGELEAKWEWSVPYPTTYMEVFKAEECPLTNTLSGYVLLIVSNEARFYSLRSLENPPELIFSFNNVYSLFMCSNIRRLVVCHAHFQRLLHRCWGFLAKR